MVRHRSTWRALAVLATASAMLSGILAAAAGPAAAVGADMRARADNDLAPWVAVNRAVATPAQPTTADPQEPAVTDSRTTRPDVRKLAEATAAAERDGQTRVLVGLRTVFTPEGRQALDGSERQRREITRLQDTVLARLHTGKAVRRFSTVPMLVVTAQAAEIRAIAASDAVATVELDRRVSPGLSTTTKIVGSKAANQRGVTGQGQTVAVLDTGVDSAHPFLTGRIVDEACFGSCPNGQSAMIGAGSGINCPLNITGCDHGTHVAGIAAGAQGPGTLAFNGVAPSAALMSVNVFHRVDNTWPFKQCGNDPSPCARSWISDQIAGLEHVYNMRSAFRVAAVNMSLGDDTKQVNTCSWAWTAPMIDNLRSAGIPTIIAAGNAGHVNGLSEPACVPSAIAVGATDKNDNVASFSNSASYLGLLAPGVSVTSSVPGGGFASFSGTSMAAPHVAGAFALIRQQYPWASVWAIQQRLRQTGPLLTDPKSGRQTPRLDVDRALRFATFNHDLNRDLAADYTVWRPSTGQWFAPGFGVTTWGMSGDVPVPGEYNGNDAPEQAIWRPATGEWWIVGQSPVPWGVQGDVPVPGDYNGDGRTDIAVWRPSTGRWYVRNHLDVQWGAPGDVPVPGDYNGDGRTDIAVWRPSTGRWYVWGLFDVQWGAPGDVPVPGDYNGDLKADVAIWRPSTGQWFVKDQFVVQLGVGSDIAAARDLTGDGRTDPAIWRPSTGEWQALLNLPGIGWVPITYQFGTTGDIPI